MFHPMEYVVIFLICFCTHSSWL